MDLSGPQSLSSVLEAEELQLVPEAIQKKLSAYIEKFSDEYCKERAAAHRQAEAEQKAEDLQNRIDDFLVKFTNFEQNVQELRTQLDQVSAERTQLLERVTGYDQNLSAIRKEKNAIVEERDSLIKVIERQNAELERLKQDLHMYQNQLSNAIAAKCEAIARVDEIQSKEVALDIKERRLESERAMLQQEIQLVTSDLNRTSAEVQNIRRENSINTLHLEARLKEKTDEVQLLQTQNAQSSKTIEDLNRKIEGLNDTIYQHNMATEKYVDTLKKELDAKEKLVEIYKNTDGENVAERNELLQGISDMKRMLNEATEEYGRLENEMLELKEKHGQEVTEQNKTIDSLKREILHANDLLKQAQEQSLESAICKLAPSAAVASRLLKSDLSLTELYSMYAKANEDLELKNRENAQLKLQIKSILDELNENAPMFEKQSANYHKLSEAHDLLLQQRDELVESKLSLDHELEKTRFNLSTYARENRKLKQTQSDLSRQVCMLLDEVNCLRAGVTRKRQEDHNASDDLSSQGLINKNLVTFDSIAEMQENNAKLLALVRELTTSLEEYEDNNDKLALQQTEEKLKKATERFADMEEVLAQKNQTVQTLLAKCERYKKFFFDAQKKLGKKSPIDLDDSNADINESLFETSAKAEATALSQEETDKLERRIRQLQEQLEDEGKKYASLKENYDYYTSEKRKNDALAQDQFDAMRKEVRELTSANCKLLNASEFQKEQIELLHKNSEIYKQQISALEDRTKNYEKTIIKHEQTVHMLKDEVMSAHRKQAAADAEAHTLRHENRVLKDTASRLQIEREGYHREQQSQNLLLNNLEFIKANLERSEAEGRLRVEQRLDDTLRELAAQRRHFQEEEEKFRETVNELKRQTETAIKQKDEEKQQAEKWQAELVTVREELAQKIEQLNELSKKLQESLTPSMNENPITAANKKARDFELKFEQAKVEIESLTKEVAKAREHGQQFYKMSQTGEAEIKRLHDMHTETVQKLEEQIKQLKNTEAELQTRITDLEAEALLTNVTEQSKNTNQSDQLKLAQEELKNVLEKLTESGRTVRQLRASNTSLAESLNAVEVKYANEMVLHSADIQELAKFKSDFFKLQDELNRLKSGRESLQAAHDELLKANAEAQQLLDQEKANSESRVADLTALNSTLHDQIEALTTKLAAISQSAASLNESALLEQSSASQMDISAVASGEENKNNEQLLSIIKFLRKEKDIFAAKLDILKAENARLMSEHTIQQKKVDELNGYLNQERSKSQTDVTSANKHEEVLRKIETLNAITDSNRILREERDALTRRVAELTDRISSVEKELFPLQCSNKELTSKIEELNVENTSLRTEAMKWRQRANALVEKSNRNPEEFKRLQSEREHLAKLLTSEKELSRKQQDEVAQLKTRLDTEVSNMVKAMQTQNETNKKLTEEAVTLRQANGRQTAELMELKNRLLQKEEQLIKANEDLETKDKAIQDKDTKELQLRKLAKRYKDYYMGLQAQTGQTADTISELEKVRSELDEVNAQLRASKEDQEKLSQANEELKKRVEPQSGAADAANAAVRQEYKAKLDKLVLDLTVARTDLANQETSFAGTRTIYDESIARLEKELQDTITANKEVNLRLTRENEALHMRVNQLTRQLGTQQSTKPSTSSVAEKGNISDSSPRTANVKPMSGSAMATVQQSATVQPWRGGETPLASIRPISLQNRTAAILPTSQQPSAGSASTSTSTSTSSSSSSSSSSSTSTTTSSASASGSSSAVANTALVPPQQQVHTTAGSAALESMASSSPTSSHTDYMPSTSSAAVAVAAIPPMGASSAAESSQEAESIQHSQQNDSQLFASGSGGAQQQVVALVSPRVEGSSSTSTSTSTTGTSATVPSVQQDASTQQQPSTSGSSSSSSTVVSSHSRHTPSSSSVTTTQAVKRPRDVEGDSSTNADGEGVPEKMVKLTKRLRAPMHSGELSAGHIGDSGMDVDQMPTSSQRDQEDEIQVVDSDEEEEDALVEGDAIDGGEAEQVGYEDSYEQDNDMMDDNENGDDEHVMAADAQDNNEVDIEETREQQLEAQEESQLLNSQAVAAVAASVSNQENNQSQAITSGSGESSNPAASTSASSSAAVRRTESSSVEIVSSVEQPVAGVEAVAPKDVPDESAGTSSVDAGTSAVASSPQKTSEAGAGVGVGGEGNVNEANKLPDMSGSASTGAENNASEADEAFAEETDSGQAEESQQQGNENQNVGTSQSSEVSENQANQGENPAEENEGTDGVSSEGEKQAVEVEEEGREAEATSPSENTRYRTLRSGVPTRRGGRSMNRGNTANNPNRPPRIVYGDSSPGVSLRQDQGGQNNRIFAPRTRSRRPLRRPAPNNFNNGGRYQ